MRVADYLSVGDHVLGRRVRRQHPERVSGVSGHRGWLPQGVSWPVVGCYVVGRHDDSWVLVTERLVEDRWPLAVPGLVGLAADACDRDVGLVVDALVVDALVPLEEARQQEPEAGDPGEHEDPRDDVDDVAGRERSVVDAGAGVGPLRRQGQLGRAEQEHHRRRPPDDHEDGERIPEGCRGRAPQCETPSEGLAEGRLGVSPSPGGRLDTSGDSTGRARSSTVTDHLF